MLLGCEYPHTNATYGFYFFHDKNIEIHVFIETSLLTMIIPQYRQSASLLENAFKNYLGVVS